MKTARNILLSAFGFVMFFASMVVVSDNDGSNYEQVAIEIWEDLSEQRKDDVCRQWNAFEGTDEQYARNLAEKSSISQSIDLARAKVHVLDTKCAKSVYI